MTWWKKVIFYTLSTIILSLTACNNNEIFREEKNYPSQSELVSKFFSHLNELNKNTVESIDSLGTKIASKDSVLDYLPYNNEYQNSSFIFSSKERSAFDVFEESTFLSQHEPTQQSYYKVWRKKLNEIEVLDLSIEPHPTLKWLFVIRLREQE